MGFRAQAIVGTLVAVFLVGGCSPSITVVSDHNPEANFSNLHTFAWLPVEHPKTGDPRADSALLGGRVRRAAVANLKAKGFKEVAPNAKPDFYVFYQAAVDDKISVHSTPSYYGYGGWWGGGYGPYGGYPMAMGTQTTVNQYEMGTLIIDIVDRERDDLIWRGSGQAKLRKKDTRSSAERDKDMTEAVTAILEGFPPTASR